MCDNAAMKIYYEIDAGIAKLESRVSSKFEDFLKVKNRGLLVTNNKGYLWIPDTIHQYLCTNMRLGFTHHM